MVKISFPNLLGKANAMSTILKILKFEVHEIGYTSSNGIMVIMTPSHGWFMGWRMAFGLPHDRIFLEPIS